MELQDLQDINYACLQDIINSAVVNIEKAVETYSNLIKKAEVTPYDETVINKLMVFDYKGFSEENGLNSIIFAECEEFLKTGDITGLFREVHADLKDIAGVLEEIKEEISKNSVPKIPGLWKLNEKFAYTSIFGSYVARVFNEINLK